VGKRKVNEKYTRFYLRQDNGHRQAPGEENNQKMVMRIVESNIVTNQVRCMNVCNENMSIVNLICMRYAGAYNEIPYMKCGGEIEQKQGRDVTPRLVEQTKALNEQSVSANGCIEKRCAVDGKHSARKVNDRRNKMTSPYRRLTLPSPLPSSPPLPLWLPLQVRHQLRLPHLPRGHHRPN